MSRRRIAFSGALFDQVLFYSTAAGGRRSLAYLRVKQNYTQYFLQRQMVSTFEQFWNFALGTRVDHYIFTDLSSARQLAMKRGVAKGRHLL